MGIELKGRYMKKKITLYDKDGTKIEKTINYLPVRYTISILLSIFSICVIVLGVVYLSLKFGLFWYLSIVVQVLVIISIVCSNDNPDYKVPWLLIVMLLPIAGYMCYFLFYRRKVSKKYTKKVLNYFGKKRSAIQERQKNSFLIILRINQKLMPSK